MTRPALWNEELALAVQELRLLIKLYLFFDVSRKLIRRQNFFQACPTTALLELFFGNISNCASLFESGQVQ